MKLIALDGAGPDDPSGGRVHAALALPQTPAIPHWLYRLIGRLVWYRRAMRHGALKLLRLAPYARPA